MISSHLIHAVASYGSLFPPFHYKMVGLFFRITLNQVVNHANVNLSLLIAILDLNLQLCITQ